MESREPHQPSRGSLLAVLAISALTLGGLLLSALPESVSLARQPQRVASWTPVFTETFESEISSSWIVTDVTGSNNGEYYWAATAYTASQGITSTWATGGGADGSLLDPGVDDYPHNALTYMIRGPLNLSGTTGARLVFDAWLDIPDDLDSLQVIAATESGSYQAVATLRGESQEWLTYTVDMDAYAGEPEVWVGFRFSSNEATSGLGAFVDNVMLESVVGTNIYLPSVRNDPALTPTPQPPTATPEPDGDVEPYADAPLCPSHDDRAFHTLWDAERGWHYDHEHGDNPHDVDHIFGTEFYDWAGGEISYPWQTPDENVYKHGGYGWYVREYSDEECSSRYADGCVKAFRVQAHGVGAIEGAVAPFHSVWVEEMICDEADPTDCGIVRSGGWQGPVDLIIDGVRVLDRENSANRHFLAGYLVGSQCCETWYSGLRDGFVGVALEFGDRWSVAPAGEGCVSDGGVVTCDSYYDTAEQLLAAKEWKCDDDGDGMPEYADCRQNSSHRQPHIIGTSFHPGTWDLLDPDGDGRAAYDGYSNRYGAPVDGCTEVGLDCVPLIIEGEPRTEIGYQYRGDAREYDLCFDDVTGEVTPVNSGSACGGGRSWSGWIEFQIMEQR